MLSHNADVDAPEITFDELVTQDATPALSGTVDDPTATVTLMIAGQTFDATNHGNGTWTLADDVIPDGLLLDPGRTLVRVFATDEAGNEAIISGDIVIPAEEPAQVLQVAINDGSSDSRSRITSLTVTFDSEVTIDEGAFTVRDRSDGAEVDLAWDSETVNGQTIATITFSGSLTEYDSLQDGNYELLIDSTKVHSIGGLDLDGDADGQQGGDYVFGDEAVDDFFRFFGDVDGSRSIRFNDLAQMLFAYESPSDYREDLDFDGDGALGFSDLVQVLFRYDTDLDFE